MLSNVKTWLRELIEIGAVLVSLAVILQIIFGGNFAFIGFDVIGNLQGIVKMLGESGLVGLITLGIIAWLVSFRAPEVPPNTPPSL